MSRRDDGGPAFPFSSLEPDPETRALVGTIYKDNEGMTLRDYFAAKAMQSIIAAMSAGQHSPRADMSVDDSLAVDAYAVADAMLRARDKEQA